MGIPCEELTPASWPEGTAAPWGPAGAPGADRGGAEPGRGEHHGGGHRLRGGDGGADEGLRGADADADAALGGPECPLLLHEVFKTIAMIMAFTPLQLFSLHLIFSKSHLQSFKSEEWMKHPPCTCFKKKY